MVRQIVGVFAALCLSIATGTALAAKVIPGMVAPPFELETGSGEEFTFPGDATGQASILFFWATWCPYCKAVMPYLDQVVEDYAEYGVRVYAIDFKDDGLQGAGFAIDNPTATGGCGCGKSFC